MARSSRATYEFRHPFRAPLGYVYAWCTDYSIDDPRLAREEYTRRLLGRTARRVIFEDLEDQPDGWHWSHDVITLRPPNRWHADVTGSHRHWKIDYALRELPRGGCELHFHGRRTVTALGGTNPSQREMLAELRTLWGNYAAALERDFRSSGRRRTTAR